MLNVTSRMKASGLVAGLVLALAGCAGPPPEPAPPPPMAAAESPPQPPTPDLAGGPASAAPAPDQAQPEQTAQMAPIPNPEDLAPADRARVYGHGYDHYSRHRHERAEAAPAEPAPAAEPAPTMAPVPATRSAHTTHIWSGHVHVAHWRHAEHPVQTAGLKPGLKPVAPAPAPASGGVTDRLTQLQAKLSGPVADGAGFVVADDIAAGKPGAVTLSLPADLFQRLRGEADKLGLDKDARRFNITATLSGDGYVITPAAPQTAHATPVDAPGAAAPSFTWQVQPQAGAGGPLKAAVVAQLTGGRAIETVPLLSLERPVKAVQPAPAPEAENGPFNLNLGDTEIPGLGKAPVSSILAVLLLILVLIILVAAARHTAEREREERRKARAAARAALQAEDDVDPSGEFARPAVHANAEPTLVVHTEPKPENV